MRRLAACRCAVLLVGCSSRPAIPAHVLPRAGDSVTFAAGPLVHLRLEDTRAE